MTYKYFSWRGFAVAATLVSTAWASNPAPYPAPPLPEVESFHSGVLIIGKRDQILARQAYGRANEDSRFDLASLTKPLSTALAIHHLVDRGLVSIEDRIGKYFSGFSTGIRSEIRVADLLSHQSGLPAALDRSYYSSAKQSLVSTLARVRLISQPRTSFRYSDLNYILLGELVRKVSGMPLSQYVVLSIYRPMGLVKTSYSPRSSIPTQSGVVATTPHDPIAKFLFPRSLGHAGLFSTADEVAALAQMLLGRGLYQGKRILSEAAVERLTTTYGRDGMRTLGFDRDSPYALFPRGPFSPTTSFGHTGYTGTSLWIDPDTGMFVVLLTNRTYFGDSDRTKNAIASARSSLAYSAQSLGASIP